MFDKKIEHYYGQKRVATPDDEKRAIKYALKDLCENTGHIWSEGETEFSYGCIHSQKTCLDNSKYPTRKGDIPAYYEWRNAGSDDWNEVTSFSGDYSNDAGGVCILGNETFRELCEKDKLRYDSSNGKCFTTKEYCNSRLLAFCDNDCFEDPISLIGKNIVGTTIARTIGGTNLLTGVIHLACNKK